MIECWLAIAKQNKNQANKPKRKLLFCKAEINGLKGLTSIFLFTFLFWFVSGKLIKAKIKFIDANPPTNQKGELIDQALRRPPIAGPIIKPTPKIAPIKPRLLVLSLSSLAISRR